MSKDINPQRQLKRLIRKYCRGKATSDEAAFLDQYYSYFNKEEKISDSLSSEEINVIEERIFKNIMSDIETHSNNQFHPFYYRKAFRLAAAIVFVLLGISTLLLMENNRTGKMNSEENKKMYALAESPKEVSGNVVFENSSQEAYLNTRKNDSLIAGNTLMKEIKEQIVIKTITTPRGGEYKVTLPDGTMACMNAASSIEYPSKFIDNERRINVTGEVYLEVSKDSRRPFIVKVNNSTEIRVLGTHFNINAYPEEKIIKTTLLEGSVQVINSSGHFINLSPGQQSTTDEQGNISVKNANIEEVMAWMNGIFQFNSLSVEEIMRQISRWYNVEIIYHGNKQSGKFSGIVNRNTTLPEVLNMLELSGIICRIDGNSVIVIK